MDTVLETPQEAAKGYTKKHISIPESEVEQMEKISSDLCNHFGFSSYSQMNRFCQRDVWKRVMVQL